MQEFDWNEIHKHNSKDDCWLVIKGKVYDVSQWVSRHPGGDLIMQGAGREATPFFVPYHPSKVSKMLNKYEIGSVKNYNPFYTWNSEFYDVLKRRVETYLSENKVDNDHFLMYFKTFMILLFWCISFYYSMVQGFILGAICYGFFNAQIGISIAHDGNHGSYSKNKTINFLAAFMTDIMGGSWIIWTMQHNIGHHPHANRQGDYEEEHDFDPDSRSGFPLVRLSPHFVKLNHHQYQQYYIWLLFPFVGAKWMYGDFKYFIKNKYQTMQFWNFSSMNFKVQILTKVLFFLHSFILPVYLHGIVQGIILSSILFAVNSYVFCLLFAVNHLTDESIFPSNSDVEKDWAKLQVMTSTNFSPNSLLTLWISGGLNYQIEHHLFPYLGHLHLPKISAIVKQTCKQYDVPYYSFPTYYDAISSYFQHLQRMGKPEEEKVKSKTT